MTRATSGRRAAWRTSGAAVLTAWACCGVPSATAQMAAAAGMAAVIGRQQAEKATQLRPHAPGRAERLMDRLEGALLDEHPSAWHPFFENAYQGGGLTVGAGRYLPVGRDGLIDVRGSLTARGYARAEVAYVAPHLPGPGTEVHALAGWRKATQVGFFGLGTTGTSERDRVNYGFEQPYAQVQITARPWTAVRATAGIEYNAWTIRGGAGDAPSIEQGYGPEDLPGLDARPTYVQPYARVAVDTRAADGYARAGTLAAVRAASHAARGGALSFRQMTYEVVHHRPLYQDLWVLSFRTRIETTHPRAGAAVPFYLLPSLGGGDTLRGFTSWRFRDRHSLLLAAEWRVLVNRFIDVAAFADAGKVVDDARRLDLQHLQGNVGVGVRLHGLRTTRLRIDVARSREGFTVVFAAGPPF